MSTSPFLSQLASALAPHGLNMIGVVSRSRYDERVPGPLAAEAIHPPTQSIVVVGSGGRAHWDGMIRHIEADPPTHLGGTSHPLDDYGKWVFAGLGSLLSRDRVLHPHNDAPVHLDFLRLGELAGLGRESELGLMVSEKHGPWFGLRAAIFTSRELPETPPHPRACDGCPAPCRTACPGSVVGDWPFPWADCVRFRRQPGSPCRNNCAARRACIVAPEAAYSDLQILYHYDRAAGRAELCRRYGVEDVAGPGRSMLDEFMEGADR